MSVVTRFAPSPTGFLHIGGARTAYFNWLFARHHNGKFLLRIEDTDRARSTQEAIDAIHEGLKWIGLEPDEEVYYQFARADRHAEIARLLVDQGKAYFCYTSPEELNARRDEAKAASKPFRFDSPWRDALSLTPPEHVDPVIRLKAPREGEVIIADAVQGDVTIACEQLDDMILLRSDGTPTYMLAVVVDDHDMEVTHVIRGDDHLTNAARQMLLYQALDWSVPQFAHVPMILGPDGAKLSKRHGALGVEAYRDMGYLPEAMRNYLLRLGWSHGDDEIISTEQAIDWFTLDSVGQSPSRFDFTKLENLNGHYLRGAHNDRLVTLIVPKLEDKLGRPLDEDQIGRLMRGMNGLKERAKTVLELAENAFFYVADRPLKFNEQARALLKGEGEIIVHGILPDLQKLDAWNHDALLEAATIYAEKTERKLGKVAQPLRAALTGSHISPSVFDVMEVLGKQESLDRLKKAC